MDRTTDTSFVLNRDSDYVIEVSKSGYKPASLRVNHHATGSDAEGAPKFELDDTAVNLTLEPAAAPAGAPAAAAAPAPVAGRTAGVTAAVDAASGALDAAKARLLRRGEGRRRRQGRR